MQIMTFACTKCGRKEEGENSEDIAQTGQFVCTFCKAQEVSTQDEARQLAIDWQNFISNLSLSYGELIEYQNCFIPLAKKFGLTEEFQENGII